MSLIVPNADLKFARDTLRAFIDAVALARALQELHPQAYSLKIARNAAFDVGVISWCILFGSDHAQHQKLHWKHMFDADPFRDGLLAAVGLTLDEWSAYHKGMVDYRNELAAHRDLNPDTTHHPNFTKGLLAADFYYERLRERIQVETGQHPEGGTLTEHYVDRHDLFLKQMTTAVAALVD